MTDASKHVTEELQTRGYRLTKARQKIAETLAKSKKSLTIQELVNLVEVDEASVYRTIDTLKKEGLVSVVKIIDGKDQYELAHGHHHHLVCTDCGLVEHIPCGSVKAPQPLPKTFSTIDSHEVTFYGCCAKCV